MLFGQLYAIRVRDLISNHRESSSLVCFNLTACPSSYTLITLQKQSPTLREHKPTNAPTKRSCWVASASCPINYAERHTQIVNTENSTAKYMRWTDDAKSSFPRNIQLECGSVSTQVPTLHPNQYFPILVRANMMSDVQAATEPGSVCKNVCVFVCEKRKCGGGEEAFVWWTAD